MKTTIHAKIVIETEKYEDVYGPYKYSDNAIKVLTLADIKEEIKTGNFSLEWINSSLSNEQEPTLIIKI